MNIIFLNPRRGTSVTLNLPRRWGRLLLMLVLVLPVVVGVGAYYITRSAHQPLLNLELTERWQGSVREHRQEVAEIEQRTREEIRALTIQLADMQARLLRLDALGERLVGVSGIKADEFDFSSAPALGGPESYQEGIDHDYHPPAFVDAITDLATLLEQRERQLSILEGLLNKNNTQKHAEVSGRPVTRGWMSSRFGVRSDPFSGRRVVHRGVDFAGKEGTDILATGAGVVTYAGERGAYGLMVEINHGNGLVTRYAHASRLDVNTGDIVKSGDLIAAIGSTGRSTGPHLHYEVLRNGQHVNPEPFLNRRR